MFPMVIPLVKQGYVQLKQSESKIDREPANIKSKRDNENVNKMQLY